MGDASHALMKTNFLPSWHHFSFLPSPTCTLLDQPMIKTTFSVMVITDRIFRLQRENSWPTMLFLSLSSYFRSWDLTSSETFQVRLSWCLVCRSHRGKWCLRVGSRCREICQMTFVVRGESEWLFMIEWLSLTMISFVLLPLQPTFLRLDYQMDALSWFGHWF